MIKEIVDQISPMLRKKHIVSEHAGIVDFRLIDRNHLFRFSFTLFDS